MTFAHSIRRQKTLPANSANFFKKYHQNNLNREPKGYQVVRVNKKTFCPFIPWGIYDTLWAHKSFPQQPRLKQVVDISSANHGFELTEGIFACAKRPTFTCKITWSPNSPKMACLASRPSTSLPAILTSEGIDIIVILKQVVDLT
jgi:hypothetical protein